MKKTYLFLLGLCLIGFCACTTPEEPANPGEPSNPSSPTDPVTPEPATYTLSVSDFSGGLVRMNGEVLLKDTTFTEKTKLHFQFIPDGEHIYTGCNLFKGCAARDSLTISKDLTLSPKFEKIQRGVYDDTHIICNYNIRYYNGSGNSSKDWPNRKEKVFEMIRKHNMDVCGIEEITSYQSPQVVATLTEYEYIGYGRDNGKENSAGASGEQTGILYKKDRYIKLDQGRFFLSSTPYKPSKVSNSDFNRLVTWVRLKDRMSDDEFFFFATHFNHNYTPSKVAVRTQQAEIAIQVVPLIAGNVPYFFVGDFNCETSEPAYAKLSERWTDAFIAMGDEAQGGYICNEEQQTNYPTQCEWPGNTYTGLYSSDDKSPKRIDLVLFDDAQATISYYLADNDDMGLELYPSDHLPIVTKMQLK